MKKFLAVFFAVIFALSSMTVAFASEADLTCDTCFAKCPDAKAYAAHVNGGCLVDFKACQYCETKVATDDLAAHEASCPKSACSCKYCGEDFETVGKYDAHIEACKAANNNIPMDEIKDKVVDTVKSIDWKGLLDKVIGVVKGIDFDGLIAKVKPVIEKVVELVKGAIPA